VEHNFLDELSRRSSPVHRVEARLKAVGALVLIVAAVLLPPERTWPFAAYLALLGALLAVARLPLAPVLRRLAGLAPFVLTAVVLLPFTRPGDGTVSASLRLGGWELRLYRAGLLAAKAVLLKSLISGATAVLLVCTTPFAGLLRALERLHFPRLLLTIIAFLYRYLFLLQGEFLRLTRAARSRNWQAGPLRVRLAAAGGIVGSLFLRTYSRGERVYTAMLARGYDGRFRTLTDPPLTRGAAELSALGVFLVLVLGILIAALLPAPRVTP
jgi:cobalt/nickel transport system permease protein